MPCPTRGFAIGDSQRDSGCARIPVVDHNRSAAKQVSISASIVPGKVLLISTLYPPTLIRHLSRSVSMPWPI